MYITHNQALAKAKKIYKPKTISFELSLQDRLDCPHSYCSENIKELQCDYEFCKICDGTLYEHCLWDMKENNKAKILEILQTTK